MPKPEHTWCVRRLQEATLVRVELGEETFAFTLCKRGAIGDLLEYQHGLTFFMGYFWLLWGQELKEGCIIHACFIVGLRSQAT